ncbi:Uncharacterised protein [Chromobacterium violaceum]|uniref:Uncharacterized protein n=1 Tax=Chromobacterium violaceum TaxID=536 RepID=A0A3S4LIT8_CHRVL|nr:Uncharacterised protein [Chromobacterium violaceum]
MADSISVTATVLLVSIALTTGLLIHRVSSEAHEHSLRTMMSNSVKQRAALLTTQFGISGDIARRIYQRPAVQKLLEDASNGRLDASAAAAELAARNHMTLNGIAIEDGGGRTLVQVGYFESRPRQALALRSPAGAQLLWNGHYLYRTVDVYRTSAGSSRLVLEQRLDMFDRIVQDTARATASAACTPCAATTNMICAAFPNRRGTQAPRFRWPATSITSPCGQPFSARAARCTPSTIPAAT